MGILALYLLVIAVSAVVGVICGVLLLLHYAGRRTLGRAALGVTLVVLAASVAVGVRLATWM